MWLQVITVLYSTGLLTLIWFISTLTDLSYISGGIQFATAQLPHLEIMDCGMTICEPDSGNPIADENNHKLQKMPIITNLHLTNQKLIIKHSCLKKLSLWGCSGLDVSFIWLSKFIEHVSFSRF